MPAAHADAVVIGAGVVGAACALALAREGLAVCVVDTDFPGGGSTSAAMGHLVVMDDSEPQMALTAYSRSLWESLAEEMPGACECEVRGTLWIAETDAELDAARAKEAAYVRHGVAASLVDGEELRRLEPLLRPGLAGALHVPDDCVLYPPGAARWMVQRAVEVGAVLRDRCRVVEIGAGFVHVEDGSGARERIDAGVVVNAAGIDAVGLIPGLPIVPRKGHLVITDRYPGMCRSQLVELGYLASAHTMTGESVAFNVQPRATGQLLIGSSRELVGRDARINDVVLRAMLARALHFLPVLASCHAIRAWTGFRPATPDKLPLIGAWEAIPGLFIAAGHEGLGITMAPGTAALIAAAVMGHTPPIDATPFDPARAMPVVHATTEH